MLSCYQSHVMCRIKYCRIQELRNCSFSFKTSSFAKRNSYLSLRCGSSRQVTFEVAKRILWPQKYNLLNKSCKPKLTNKGQFSGLSFKFLPRCDRLRYQFPSGCWYLCLLIPWSWYLCVLGCSVNRGERSIHKSTMHFVFELCKSQDSLVYGFRVLKADGYQDKDFLRVVPGTWETQALCTKERKSMILGVQGKSNRELSDGCKV